jgi:transketolase
MVFGQARTISKGNDITVLSSGICTEEAMRATEALKKHGISVQHMHISTLKPFNDVSVLEAIENTKHCVITMENHTIIGGLGTIIAEKMAEEGTGKKLVRIGLKDTFAHGASKTYLMREYEIDAMALINTVEKIFNTSFGITEEDLREIYVAPMHSKAKAEAL